MKNIPRTLGVLINIAILSMLGLGAVFAQENTFYCQILNQAYESENLPGHFSDRTTVSIELDRQGCTNHLSTQNTVGNFSKPAQPLENRPFSQSIEDATGNVDTTPPLMTHLEVAPRAINVTSNQVVVDVTVWLEDESGVGHADFWIRNYEHSLYHTASSQTGWQSIEADTYSNTFTFLFDNTKVAGLWEVTSTLGITDELGNRTSQYDSNIKMRSEGFDPGIMVINENPSKDSRLRYDQNGDGKADIVWRSSVSGENWLYGMNGPVIADSKPINIVSAPWSLAGRADFDGDGKSDLLWRNGSTGLNYIYLMDGATISAGQAVNTVPVVSWDIVSIGDYNGDGRDDVLWRNSATGELWQYQMDGFDITASQHVTTISDNDWQIVGSPDLNGDGKADLLFRHTSTGLVWKYIMNGHVIASSAEVMAASTEWQLVITGDFDGDSDADFLWRNKNDGRNYVYLLDNGVINWNARGEISKFTDQNWQAVMAGDFDGDGDDDIFWRHFGDGSNYMYLMNGTGYEGRLINTVGDLTWVPIK